MNLISKHKLNFIVHPGSGKRSVTLEVGERLDERRSSSRSPLIRCKVKAGVFHCQHYTEATGDPVDESEMNLSDETVSETPDDQLEGDVSSHFSSSSSDYSDEEIEEIL